MKIRAVKIGWAMKGAAENLRGSEGVGLKGVALVGLPDGER